VIPDKLLVLLSEQKIMPSFTSTGAISLKIGELKDIGLTTKIGAWQNASEIALTEINIKTNMYFSSPGIG
jgi:hypothetical protein